MTRFARAKGSKASNEKLPEKPTSWSIMKQQLLEKTNSVEDKRKYLEVKNQRNASYQKFLAEKEEEESKNVKWADFPGANLTKSNKKKAGVTKKKSKPILSSEASFDESDDEEFNELKAKIDKALEEQEANSESDAPEEHSSKNEVKPPEVAKTRKVKAKKLKIVSYKESKVILKKDQDAKAIEHEKKSKIPGGKNTGNNKNAQQTTESENKLSELDLRKKEKKLERRRKQVEKKKAVKLQMKAEKMNKKDGDKKGEVNQESTNKPDPSEEELKKMEKKKEKKLKQLERRKLKKKLLKEQKEAELKLVETDVDKRQNRCEADDPLITSNLEPKLKNNFNKGNKGIEKINQEHNSNQGNYNKKLLLQIMRNLTSKTRGPRRGKINHLTRNLKERNHTYQIKCG
ncbi:unnamed protein product [Acanthoscelides obtectus]|uniref:Uncharacterized protein n=1 Tax=Acanthoscelides obtectus TaxID=200917 RepID=A0A9P0PC00_ACAOB|nr:unnamed protein product [Acanthoscelides obtectus]CAK1636035.1 hypothetical protein AOBTE_LOCUS9700 [Acanthoscelides obtectus]